MLSLKGASDFSSSTKHWKRNNAFTVSTDVPNALCFSYSHAQVKLQASPSVVFSIMSDCIFSPMTEMLLVVDYLVLP